MRNNNNSGYAEMASNVLEDQGLAGWIETRRGLVQNQNSRLLEKCPRDSEALTLPSGELATARSDALPETVRQGCDKRGESRGSNSILKFGLTGARPTQAEIGAQCPVKQDRLTPQIANLPPQTLQSKISEVFACQPDRPMNRIMKPDHQFRERALASSVLTHDSDLFTGQNP
jgi:hypothetical protein